MYEYIYKRKKEIMFNKKVVYYRNLNNLYNKGVLFGVFIKYL